MERWLPWSKVGSKRDKGKRQKNSIPTKTINSITRIPISSQPIPIICFIIKEQIKNYICRVGREIGLRYLPGILSLFLSKDAVPRMNICPKSQAVVEDSILNPIHSPDPHWRTESDDIQTRDQLFLNYLALAGSITIWGNCCKLGNLGVLYPVLEFALDRCPEVLATRSSTCADNRLFRICAGPPG